MAYQMMDNKKALIHQL